MRFTDLPQPGIDEIRRDVAERIVRVRGLDGPGAAPAIVHAVCRALPRLATWGTVLSEFGLQSRFAARRRFASSGLAGLSSVRSAAWLVFCHRRRELMGLSLERQAFIDSVTASVYYRRVRSVVGVPWSHVEQLPCEALMQRIRPIIIRRAA